MAAPRKYLFDVSFDQTQPAGAARKTPEPSFTRAELEAARIAGFAAGRSAALAEAAQNAEQRAAAALEAISRGIAVLIDTREQLARETEGHALALVRAALQKAVPALCRKDPLAEIETVLSDCLSEAADEPRLVLRVSDALFEAVQARLASIAAAAGYAGKLVLLADGTLADGDCRVEWADGGAERDARRLAADIDALLARGLVSLSAAPIEEKNHD